jgi:hypothetical protein
MYHNKCSRQCERKRKLHFFFKKKTCSPQMTPACDEAWNEIFFIRIVRRSWVVPYYWREKEKRSLEGMKMKIIE